MTRICSVDGCGAAVRCKGVCNRHYHEIKKAKRLKPCACGCGELTSYTYKHGHHTRLLPPEEQARRGRMNDGAALRDTGGAKSYRKVGQRHEHRRVAEAKLGRPLLPGEVVHHKNGNKRDNRPENLEVMTQAQHIELHRADMLRARRG